MFIRARANRDDDHGYKLGSEINLYVVVDGRADQVVIPRQEIERLYASGARELWVSLYVNPARNPVGTISLTRRDGGLAVEVTVAQSSFHNVSYVRLMK